jgi:hypothetical protein
MQEPSLLVTSDAPLGRGPRGTLPVCSARALALWPGLDRARLVRTHGDPTRIARLVTRRTALGPEAVIALITRDLGPGVS